jgi:putative tricarboxylic transport membrane protein
MIWQPEREIEIVAGTPPGGGLDRSARALLKAITDNGLLDVPVRVVNVGGEGGRKAWRRTASRSRSPRRSAIPITSRSRR